VELYALAASYRAPEVDGMIYDPTSTLVNIVHKIVLVSACKADIRSITVASLEGRNYSKTEIPLK
jgi:hypothetical protein